MLATLLGELISAIICVSAMTQGLLSSRGPALRPRGTDTSIALGAQLGLWLLAGITTVVGRRVLPDLAAGDFAAASTITGAATFLPLAVAAAYFPRFAKSSAREVLTRALMVAAALGALVTAALSLAPSQLIRLLAGESFSADTAIVAMLSIASALVGVAGVAVFFLLARRRPAALSVWLGTAVAFACALVVQDAFALAVVALASAAVGALVTVLAAYRATDVLEEIATEIVLPGCERDVTIVVPTYNSGRALRPALDAIVATLDTTGLTYEVLVAVDGSSDGSEHDAARLSTAGRRRLLADQRGQGCGGAARVRSGSGPARRLHRWRRRP